MDTNENHHAKLSPSKSSTWLVCPGSIIQDDPNKINVQSEAAKIGTAIHALSEYCLTLDLSADNQLGKTFEGVEITEDHIKLANAYINYFQDIIDETQLSNDIMRFGFEQQARFTDDIYGTMDGYVIDYANKTIHIIDLKCGRIEVAATENTQLIIYALGLLNDLIGKGNITSKVKAALQFSDFTFRLHIVQPAIYNFDSWDISYKKLIAKGRWIEEQAKLTMVDKPIRRPGESQCKWCQNNPICGELKTYMDNLIGNEFDKMENIDHTNDTLDHLVNILNNKGLITQYLSNIEGYLLSLASAGLEDLTPLGYKLVEAKTQRKYNENAEKILKKFLGDKAYKPAQLIGITDATKLLGKNKNEIDKITVKPKGSLQLARVEDKRQQIIVNMEWD